MHEIRVAKRDTPGLWTFMMARPSTYDPNILLGKENRSCAKEV
jgi:hypothetical protein